MKTKECSKCGIKKDSSEFYKDKRNKSGMQSECRMCQNKRAKNWKINNPEKVKETNQRWAGKHSDYQHQYYLIHKRRILARVKLWRANNPDRWKQRDPAKIRNYNREYFKRRNKTLTHKLYTGMSAAIRVSLLRGIKKRRKWEKLVGYTVDQLKEHLEKQFITGMTWENHGKGGWHIDHIIPISVFNYQRPEDIDFQKCWALGNLRPLWAKENLTKHTRLDKPFQPSLLISASM